MTSLTNVTLTLPESSSLDNSNIGSIPDIGTFVNGTAAGLTCFIHPATDFVGWPYGNGGFNAVPTTTSTGGGNSESSSLVPAPGPSESGNGSRARVSVLPPLPVAFGVVGGFLGLFVVL